MSDNAWKESLRLGGASNPYRNSGAGHVMEAAAQGGYTMVGNYASLHPHLRDRREYSKPSAAFVNEVELPETAKDSAQILLGVIAQGQTKAATEVISEALATKVTDKGEGSIEAAYSSRFKQTLEGLNLVKDGARKVEGKVSHVAGLGGLMQDIKRHIPSLSDDAKQAVQALEQSFEQTGLKQAVAPYFEAAKKR